MEHTLGGGKEVLRPQDGEDLLLTLTFTPTAGHRTNLAFSHNLFKKNKSLYECLDLNWKIKVGKISLTKPAGLGPGNLIQNSSLGKS